MRSRRLVTRPSRWARGYTVLCVFIDKPFDWKPVGMIMMNDLSWAGGRGERGPQELGG